MKPQEIATGVYNVGVRDWNVRNFHGYTTNAGTTYNAYLLVDEKVCLIDTVKKEFSEQLLANISKILDPKRIDIVISNHTEMDHSGSLPAVMHRVGEDKPLYCSKQGLKNLSLHFRRNWNLRPVENGEELSLGAKTLSFMETKMLHWPDSMFTLLKDEKILFSSDAFGQHYAGPETFDDEIGDGIMPHAKKYFANILLLYTPRIQKLAETIGEAGLEFNMICPDHGIIWRENPSRIIEAYVKWSAQEPKNKALLVYDSMWHSTERMAEKIAEGITGEGAVAIPVNLSSWHRSDVMTEVLDSAAIVVGSPTLNNNMFPTVSDFLTYMQGLKPKNKIAAAFGSYGWSGEAVKLINARLEAMKLDLCHEGLRVQYVPGEKETDACLEFGKSIGKAVVSAGR